MIFGRVRGFANLLSFHSRIGGIARGRSLSILHFSIEVGRAMIVAFLVLSSLPLLLIWRVKLIMILFLCCPFMKEFLLHWQPLISLFWFIIILLRRMTSL